MTSVHVVARNRRGHRTAHRALQSHWKHDARVHEASSPTIPQRTLFQERFLVGGTVQKGAAVRLPVTFYPRDACAESLGSIPGKGFQVQHKGV